MKKIITAVAISIAAVATGNMSAEDKMIVSLKDGSTQEFNVEAIEKVLFETVEPVFTVTLPDGTTAEYPAIPSLLRQTGATGEATQFGFGNVAAETPADLTAGEYGVYFSLSPSKVYNGSVDLATETSSYVLKLVKYAEGASEFILEKVTSGTITTSINNKTQKVTVDINAEFDDGTVLAAKYEGAAKNVTNIEDMLPGKAYGNEVYCAGPSGESHANITSLTVSTSASGKTTLNFGLDSYIGSSDNVQIKLEESFLESNPGTFNMAEVTGWELKCGSVSVCNVPDSDSNKQYKNVVDNGTMKFIANADGSYEIFIEVENYYNNFMGSHIGDGTKVVFNFVGAPF